MNDRVTDSFESVIVVSHLTQQREAKFAWKNSSPKYQRRPTQARRQPEWVFLFPRLGSDLFSIPLLTSGLKLDAICRTRFSSIFAQSFAGTTLLRLDESLCLISPSTQ